MLERVMLDFLEQETDVLVSTTIIETGLDMPNVNTLIIDEADRMGLSQLYQLRGRVGRSNHKAYAYLLYKPQKVLTEVAEKRLSASTARDSRKWCTSSTAINCRGTPHNRLWKANL